MSRGYICPKGLAVDEIVNAPTDRTPWQRIVEAAGKSPAGYKNYAERFNFIKAKYERKRWRSTWKDGINKEFKYYEKILRCFRHTNFSTAESLPSVEKKWPEIHEPAGPVLPTVAA